MGSLQNGSQINLTNNSRNKIEEQLGKLKSAELEFYNSLARLVKRKELYDASRGHIDAYNLTDDQLTTVLTKHSNLLKAGNVYNKRADNLLVTFQSITNALIDKLNNDKSNGNVRRPISIHNPN